MSALDIGEKFKDVPARLFWKHFSMTEKPIWSDFLCYKFSKIISNLPGINFRMVKYSQFEESDLGQKWKRFLLDRLKLGYASKSDSCFHNPLLKLLYQNMLSLIKS